MVGVVTDPKETLANGERIRRLLDEGRPLKEIFPTAAESGLWKPLPQDPYADDHLDFVAADQHIAGRPVRSYVMACKHGTNELALPDMTEADDPQVLENMLASLRERTGCQCWPKGWRRVEVGLLQ